MKTCDKCDKCAQAPCICHESGGIKLFKRLEKFAAESGASMSEIGFAGSMLAASMVGQAAKTEEILNANLELTFRTIREMATDLFKDPDKHLGPDMQAHR